MISSLGLDGVSVRAVLDQVEGPMGEFGGVGGDLGLRDGRGVLGSGRIDGTAVPAVRLPKTAGTQGGSLSEPAREGQPVAA
jgi:hypothetical protein